MKIVMRKFKTFCSFDKNTMLSLLEAYVCLAWARILIYFPFKWTSRYLGAYMQETSWNDAVHKDTLKQTQHAIHLMERYTFWQSECLVKAIAGSIMLSRRKIASTIYLGTAKEATGEMCAHAWLRCGPYYITGAEGRKKFTIVGTFAKLFDAKR